MITLGMINTLWMVAI